MNKDYGIGIKDSKGISLIEVLVAILILNVALLGLIPAMATWIKTSTDVQARNTAIQMARSVSDTLKGLNYDNDLLSKQNALWLNAYIDNNNNVSVLVGAANDVDGDGIPDFLDPNNNGTYKLFDKGGTGRLDAAGDINNNSIDHPATAIFNKTNICGSAGCEYKIINPIERVNNITFYKVWSIGCLGGDCSSTGTDYAKFVGVVVYWFSPAYHQVNLTFMKRRS